MTDLRFVRITNMVQFEAIPRKLFEKVSDFGDHMERLYQLAPAYLARPETMLYAILTDEPKAVVGVLWIEADLLDDTFHVPLLSAENVDDTLVLSEVMKFILALAKEMGAKGIEMATDRPKAFKRYGWKVTKQVLMKLDLEATISLENLDAAKV